MVAEDIFFSSFLYINIYLFKLYYFIFTKIFFFKLLGVKDPGHVWLLL